MINFTLEVAEIDVAYDENYSFLERFLQRQVLWPTLPRKDELVGASGNMYPVLQVYHHMESEEIVVQVGAETSDFEQTLAQGEWQKVGVGFKK